MDFWSLERLGLYYSKELSGNYRNTKSHQLAVIAVPAQLPSIASTMDRSWQDETGKIILRMFPSSSGKVILLVEVGF